MPEASFDYVIVGGGTAGCVLAARLSEDPGVSVLLLEAGGRNRNPFVRVPMACALILSNPKYCTNYPNEPEAELPGRALTMPRGRGLGGSSSVNAMIYVRGHPGDFDEWADLGCEGWSFEDVQSLFKAIESFPEGDTMARGHQGPIHIRRFQTDTLSERFLEAVRQAGGPYVEDYNGPDQHGGTWTQHNIFPGRRGRCSALAAYLEPAMQRANLVVRTDATVTRIILRANKAAEGVEYVCRGQRLLVRADREVIVAAGTIRTPQLLMLSGIGPSADLRKHGIEPKVDLPGVGRNLQDHFGAYVQQECTQPITFARHTTRIGALRGVLEYVLTGAGPWSHWPAPVMAFLHTESNLNRPDIQFLFAPLIRPRAGESMGLDDKRGHGYCISWCQLRPASVGTIVLASSDPMAAPRIRHNYLADERDRAFHRRAVRLARELHAQPAFEPFRGREVDPSPACQSDSEIDSYIRAIGHTHYHPVGTAKMGRDESAVVDPTLRVRGCEALRVADASIMPIIVGANTHAPSLMIGEKAAALLRSGF